LERRLHTPHSLFSRRTSFEFDEISLDDLSLPSLHGHPTNPLMPTQRVLDRIDQNFSKRSSHMKKPRPSRHQKKTSASKKLSNAVTKVQRSGSTGSRHVARAKAAEAAPTSIVEKAPKARGKNGNGIPNINGNKPKNKRVSGRGTSLLDHAAAVLGKSKAPMNCKEIVEKVMATSDWKTNGKTPWATLYSAIIREIAEKKDQSRFTKMDRGMFAAAKGA
jgi:hypothetical protein